MDTRRDFLKKAALLGGGVGVWASLPASVKKALSIDPRVGSDYTDAEHVVILMQENRSFDHCFGSLQGVRGFNDPRAIRLPNKNKVWLQSDKEGKTYAPFRLDIHNTKSTWTGNLPHTWQNQVDARNNGGFDRWLEAKKSGYEKYKNMPLTMGYYNREDIPFYYAMADAFTVCDQYFCSSLTGTTPNRLYFFTGKLRGGKNNQANVNNEDVDYGREADWKTFPEVLEENDISWKIYQNEISLPTGLNSDEEFWLSNFTDNPMEWFSQYGVHYHKNHYKFCLEASQKLPKDIAELETRLSTENDDKKKIVEKLLNRKKQWLEEVNKELQQYTPEKFEELSAFWKSIHTKAFTTNNSDENYHKLDKIKFTENGETQTLSAPASDVFSQFRKDVNNGQLPTVSWLVAPQAFSDHPSAPWYGAWYVSETLDILTQNPEVWKKTIFILTYDENDGYFDHVPPFTVPKPGDAHSGAVSKGIDTSLEYVTLEEDILRVGEKNKGYARESPIGLGYRVPCVIASPWSRGGWVNSQVFDHTSVLQFVETFLHKKTGKAVKDPNITDWRRTVCGDLTSAFRPFDGKKIDLPFLNRNEFIESIYSTKNKQLPDGYHLFTDEEIALWNNGKDVAPFVPVQEKGVRSACALPYEIYVQFVPDNKKQSLKVIFESGKEIFGDNAAGVPFIVYTHSDKKQGFRVWSFTVKAGDKLNYEWPFVDFKEGNCQLFIYGPNGFYRMYQHNTNEYVDILAEMNYGKSAIGKPDGALECTIKNISAKSIKVKVNETTYRTETRTITIAQHASKPFLIETKDFHGWYDVTIETEGTKQQLAGHIETGKISSTDPLMGMIS